MFRLPVMFVVTLVISTLGGHFLSDRPWLNAIATTGKAVICHGFFTGDLVGKLNSGLFWGFTIVSTRIWGVLLDVGPIGIRKVLGP